MNHLHLFVTSFIVQFKLEIGGNDIQYIQAKSSSRPENNDKENRSEATGSSKKFSTYRGQETTEIPIIHGIPGDYVEVSLPPPNSIAEVLEPITRVIYKEKTFRDYKTDPEVKTHFWFNFYVLLYLFS